MGDVFNFFYRRKIRETEDVIHEYPIKPKLVLKDVIVVHDYYYDVYRVCSFSERSCGEISFLILFF